MKSKIERHIERITTPIFDKVLQETSKKRTSVGSTLKISDTYSLYNPHNYRLYFDFEKADFHPLRPTKPTFKEGGGRLGLFNSKEWKTLEQIKGCTLIVKKNTVQINNLNEAKRWYLIEMGDIEARKKQIRDIHTKKVNEAISSLKEFINIYGGKSQYHLKRIWCEEKVLKDEKVDKLPLNMFFRANNVKKAYNEANIEYFGDPVGAANYFSNRGIEDISPQIAEALNHITRGFVDFTNKALPTIEQLAVNMGTHVKIMKGIEKGINKLNRVLEQTKLNKWL